MIVLLASYPRSGNTLVRHVIEAVYDLPTFSQYRNEHEIGLWPDRGFDYAYEKDYPVCFVKTHSVDYSPHLAIHIVRDGRDAIVSEAHYAKRGTMVYGKHPTMHVMGMLVDGRGPWNWSHHCRTYSEREAPTVRVHYEELVRDPIQSVIEAVQKLELPIKPKRGPYRLQSFDELRRMNPEFYRRGKVAAYRDEMPFELQHRFWKVHAEMMEAMGYWESQYFMRPSEIKQREEASCLMT